MNKRIASRSFWFGLSAALSLIGIATGVAYNAYASRANRLEQAQKEQQLTIQRIDRTLSAVKANQDNMERKFDIVIEMLRSEIRRDGVR